MWEVKATNETDEAVHRIGMEWAPGQSREVTVNRRQLRTLTSCRALRLTKPKEVKGGKAKEETPPPAEAKKELAKAPDKKSSSSGKA